MKLAPPTSLSACMRLLPSYRLSKKKHGPATAGATRPAPLALSYKVWGWESQISCRLSDASKTRGSHTHVACRSVCDWDQNGIKRSTSLLGADQGIKINSERLTSTDQCTFSDTKEVWLHFCPWNQAIKSLGTEQSSDQGRFSPIKILDPGHKHFYRGHVCDYPLQNIHQQAICLVAIVEALCTCPAECSIGAGSVAMHVQNKTICSSKSLSVQVQPVLL